MAASLKNVPSLGDNRDCYNIQKCVQGCLQQEYYIKIQGATPDTHPPDKVQITLTFGSQGEKKTLSPW